VRRLGGLLAIPLLLTIVLAGGGAIDYEYAQAGKPPPGTARIQGPTKTFGHGLIKIGGKGAEAWRWEYVKEKRARKRSDQHRRELRQVLRNIEVVNTPERAIRLVFGPYANQALTVAYCESRLSVWARNGQYLGLFQMGDYARSRYGHGTTPLEQAHSAYLYFVDSGRDWSPWECKP
jgi:hypothetical protein